MNIQISTISCLMQQMHDAIDVKRSRSASVSIACYGQIVDEEDHSMSHQGATQDGIVGGDGFKSMDLDFAGQKQILNDFLDFSRPEKSLLLLIPANPQAAISFGVRVYDDWWWFQSIEEPRSKTRI